LSNKIDIRKKNGHLCFKIESPIENRKTPQGDPIKKASRSLKSRKTIVPVLSNDPLKTKNKSPRENPNQSDPMKNPNIKNPLSERRTTQKNLSL